jgi:CHAT domain-containing protein
LNSGVAHRRYISPLEKNPLKKIKPDIEYERIPFKPEFVTRSGTNFGKNKPVVILNTCQTTGQGYSLTGLGGWAVKFLAGAAAFIGTMWSVNDYISFQFSKKLYEQLCAGTTMGEAVLQARKYCKKIGPGNPSWLSYQLYGDPDVYIKLG